MKVNELVFDQKVIVQILWGERKIEFTTQVLKKGDNSIYVSPYLHNGKALEFNIDNTDGVVCNLFANNTETEERISWKNIKLKTEELNGKPVYLLKTSVFNQIANNDDRRQNKRIIIRKNARIYDVVSDKYTDILIHDISDVGISFYAPASYAPRSNQILIDFIDSIDEKSFNMKIECSIARTENKAGNVFYGCRTVGENKDYLIYGFLKRLKKKNG